MRTMLFLGINFMVMIMLSIAARIIAPMLGISLGGGELTTLFIFCAILGFGGAFFSLAISRWMAKRMYKIKLITAPSSKEEHFIHSTVTRMAEKAGIDTPEIGIFESNSPNAFATGRSKNSSLVALSTGLLQNMEQNEVEAVIGHEISHISNGDMVTMTLLQGVLNTFVYFFARVIGRIIDSYINRGRSGYGFGYFIIVFILEIIFGLLASIVMLWYSRRREYRADEGGAFLSSKGNMIGALQSLERISTHENAVLPNKTMANFGINGNSWSMLFRSHPPLKSRIEYLQSLQ